MLALSFKKNAPANGAAERNGGTAHNPLANFDMAKFEALIARAEQASQQLQALDTTVDRTAQLRAMEERLALLDRTLAGTERLDTQLKSAQDRASRLAASQERAEAQINTSLSEVERVKASSAELLTKISAAFELRDQLDRFLAVQPEVTAVRAEAENIGVQVRELSANVGRLRAVHEDAVRAQKHASARVDGIEQRSLATVLTMEGIERRASSAEEALESLLRIAATVPDVHHQLGVLKAAADQVAQKAALVEQQREAVDRAAGQVAHVVALMPQLETALRRQEEQSRGLSAIESKLVEVQSQQTVVLARGAEIVSGQRELEEAEQEAARSLTELRDAMKASADRFELENQPGRRQRAHRRAARRGDGVRGQGSHARFDPPRSRGDRWTRQVAHDAGHDHRG